MSHTQAESTIVTLAQIADARQDISEQRQALDAVEESLNDSERRIVAATVGTPPSVS